MTENNDRRSRTTNALLAVIAACLVILTASKLNLSVTSSATAQSPVLNDVNLPKTQDVAVAAANREIAAAIREVATALQEQAKATESAAKAAAAAAAAPARVTTTP